MYLVQTVTSRPRAWSSHTNVNVDDGQRVVKRSMNSVEEISTYRQGYIERSPRITIKTAATTYDFPEHPPKKEKKWSFGNLFRRKKKDESDSSSEDEAQRNKKRKQEKRRKVKGAGGFDHIVVPPQNGYNRHEDTGVLSEPSGWHVVGRPLPRIPVDGKQERNESVTSSNSPGSLDSTRKSRRDRAKARAAARRNGSSSDEDSQRSYSSSKFRSDESLTRQRDSSANRKSRIARTERYIRRLSKDEESILNREALQRQARENWQLKLQEERASPETPFSGLFTIPPSHSNCKYRGSNDGNNTVEQSSNTNCFNIRSLSCDSNIHKSPSPEDHPEIMHVQFPIGRPNRSRNVLMKQPPPPPPRDPRRVAAAQAEVRPASHCFDKMLQRRNRGPNDFSSHWHAGYRTASEDHIPTEPRQPLAPRPASVTNETRQSRYIKRHVQESADRFQYLTEKKPRSRKPIFIQSTDKINSQSAKSSSFNEEKKIASPNQQRFNEDRHLQASPSGLSQQTSSNENSQKYTKSSSFTGDKKIASSHQQRFNEDRNLQASPSGLSQQTSSNENSQKYTKSSSFTGDKIIASSHQQRFNEDRNLQASPSSLSQQTSFNEDENSSGFHQYAKSSSLNRRTNSPVVDSLYQNTMHEDQKLSSYNRHANARSSSLNADENSSTSFKRYTKSSSLNRQINSPSVDSANQIIIHEDKNLSSFDQRHANRRSSSLNEDEHPSSVNQYAKSSSLNRPTNSPSVDSSHQITMHEDKNLSSFDQGYNRHANARSSSLNEDENSSSSFKRYTKSSSLHRQINSPSVDSSHQITMHEDKNPSSFDQSYNRHANARSSSLNEDEHPSSFNQYAKSSSLNRPTNSLDSSNPNIDQSYRRSSSFNEDENSSTSFNQYTKSSSLNRETNSSSLNQHANRSSSFNPHLKSSTNFNQDNNSRAKSSRQNQASTFGGDKNCSSFNNQHADSSSFNRHVNPSSFNEERTSSSLNPSSFNNQDIKSSSFNRQINPSSFNEDKTSSFNNLSFNQHTNADDLNQQTNPSSFNKQHAESSSFHRQINPLSFNEDKKSSEKTSSFNNLSFNQHTNADDLNQQTNPSSFNKQHAESSSFHRQINPLSFNEDKKSSEKTSSFNNLSFNQHTNADDLNQQTNPSSFNKQHAESSSFHRQINPSSFNEDRKSSSLNQRTHLSSFNNQHANASGFNEERKSSSLNNYTKCSSFKPQMSNQLTNLSNKNLANFNQSAHALSFNEEKQSSSLHPQINPSSCNHQHTNLPNQNLANFNQSAHTLSFNEEKKSSSLHSQVNPSNCNQQHTNLSNKNLANFNQSTNALCFNEENKSSRFDPQINPSSCNHQHTNLLNKNLANFNQPANALSFNEEKKSSSLHSQVNPSSCNQQMNLSNKNLANFNQPANASSFNEEKNSSSLHSQINPSSCNQHMNLSNKNLSSFNQPTNALGFNEESKYSSFDPQINPSSFNQQHTNLSSKNLANFNRSSFGRQTHDNSSSFNQYVKSSSYNQQTHPSSFNNQHVEFSSFNRQSFNEGKDQAATCSGDKNCSSINQQTDPTSFNNQQSSSFNRLVNPSSFNENKKSSSLNQQAHLSSFNNQLGFNEDNKSSSLNNSSFNHQSFYNQHMESSSFNRQINADKKSMKISEDHHSSFNHHLTHPLSFKRTDSQNSLDFWKRKELESGKSTSSSPQMFTAQSHVQTKIFLPSVLSNEPDSVDTVDFIKRNSSPFKPISSPSPLDKKRDITSSADSLSSEFRTSEEVRRKSANLEEALDELEAIYKSLHLGDEDLLERAEQREISIATRRLVDSNSEAFPAWGSIPRGALSDSSFSYEPYNSIESPRRKKVLKKSQTLDRRNDDMAYRKLNKDRANTISNPQSVLASVSYLLASPVHCPQEDADEEDPNDEPDVTLDDVVYRSIKHANNSLKVVDPQPPFGIPIGPITPAPNSDYLHAVPEDAPRYSFKHKKIPDVVKDDLAFRNLRKDCSKEPALEHKKKRAVRSLSANISGIMHEDSDFGNENSLTDIADAMEIARQILKEKEERIASTKRAFLSDSETKYRKTGLVSASSTETITESRLNFLNEMRTKDAVHAKPPRGRTSKESTPERTLENKPSSFEDLLTALAVEARETSDRITSELNNLDEDLGKREDAEVSEHAKMCEKLLECVVESTELIAATKTESNPDERVEQIDTLIPESVANIVTTIEEEEANARNPLDAEVHSENENPEEHKSPTFKELHVSSSSSTSSSDKEDANSENKGGVV